MMPTALHPVRVYAWCYLSSQLPMPGTFATVKVDIFDVEGVDMTRNVAKDSQCDVDKQICPAAGNKEHANGWN